MRHARSLFFMLVLLPALAHAQAGGFTCLIEPRETITVGAPIVGRVSEIVVERGELVEAGQVLARLDSRVEAATVELARARSEANAEIREAEARHDFERRRLERGKQLHEENVISHHDIDEIESSLIVADAARLRARENSKTAELELSRAEAVLEQRIIRSPVDGVVVKRLAAPGEYVDPPQILEIAQVDPLRVEVYVPADQIGGIEVGKPARVYPETSGDEWYEATVIVVDRVVDAASGMIGVQLELPNPEHRVTAGLRCRVLF